MYDLALIEAALAGSIYPGKLHYAAVTGSTNTDALAAAQRRRAHGTGPDAHPWNWAPFVVAAGGVIAETAGVRP